MGETLLYIIIAFITVEFIISKILDFLNLATWQKPVPDELKDIYPSEQYQKAKAYARANTFFSLISSAIFFIISLSFLWYKGFAWIDRISGQMSSHPILHSLLFFGILGAVSFIIQLPFSIYRTFVIEEKFGFNKVTPKLFVADTIKSLVLAILVGGGLLALLAFLFEQLGSYFWLAGWAVSSAFSLFVTVFYTSILLPIFNKLTPLQNADL
ncbi:MAG: hypothetical protein NZ522_07740, partial [Chitinophagales bacterium]|nr:hypothetical protein [Chitinophagales bacterium]